MNDVDKSQKKLHIAQFLVKLLNNNELIRFNKGVKGGLQRYLNT